MMGAPSRAGVDVMVTTQQAQTEPQSEVHRCDQCGERTHHIVVLVARDHSQDIMPKEPRKAFWQAFRASSITNWAFGETLAYQATHVKHLICERCGETFLEY
jgi:formylmethanofuran dehydrogenase subunit E